MYRKVDFIFLIYWIIVQTSVSRWIVIAEQSILTFHRTGNLSGFFLYIQIQPFIPALCLFRQHRADESCQKCQTEDQHSRPQTGTIEDPLVAYSTVLSHRDQSQQRTSDQKDFRLQETTATQKFQQYDQNLRSDQKSCPPFSNHGCLHTPEKQCENYDH